MRSWQDPRDGTIHVQIDDEEFIGDSIEEVASTITYFIRSHGGGFARRMQAEMFRNRRTNDTESQREVEDLIRNGW